MMKSNLILTVALACVAAGCGRGPSISELEERERSSRLYSNAMDDFQAGRVDAAISGFQRVVLQEPKSYSAHFQLATLLQDVRKDYIGAIAHYRNYLALRPASDKATVAQDRIKLCETLLSAEIIRRAGGNASDKLSKDNRNLTAERDELAAKVAKLEAELSESKKEVEKLTRESKKLSVLFAKLQGEDLEPSARNSQSVKDALVELKAMEDEDRRRKLRPTDAELLEEGEEESPGDRIRNSVDMKNIIVEAKQEEKDMAERPKAVNVNARQKNSSSGFDEMFSHGGDKKKPVPGKRPETYVVQPGDTLYSISKRFYGTSSMFRRIRELNRAIVPPNGRINPGQELRLP